MLTSSDKKLSCSFRTIIGSLPSKSSIALRVITSKNVKVEGVVYQIDSESLWTKNIEEVTTRKAMLDFDGREPIIVRNEQESFLSDDVSIMIAYNKKNGEHIKVVSLLFFTNMNVLPFSECIPTEIISYLDPTIEYLYFKKKMRNQ